MKEIYDGEILNGVVYKATPQFYKKRKSTDHILKIDGAMIIDVSAKAYKMKISDKEFWMPKSVVDTDGKPMEWWLKKERNNLFYKKK